MRLELAHHIRARAGVVHQTDEGRLQLDVGNVLHNVAAHAAVHLLHPAGVAPAGNVNVRGIALDVHKDRAQNDNTHFSSLRFVGFCFHDNTLSTDCKPLSFFRACGAAILRR